MPRLAAPATGADAWAACPGMLRRSQPAAGQHSSARMQCAASTALLAAVTRQAELSDKAVDRACLHPLSQCFADLACLARPAVQPAPGLIASSELGLGASAAPYKCEVAQGRACMSDRAGQAWGLAALQRQAVLPCALHTLLLASIASMAGCWRSQRAVQALPAAAVLLIQLVDSETKPPRRTSVVLSPERRHSRDS